MTNDNNVLTQIQAALPGLSKSDTKIAQVVLADPEAATHASIALLAQQANVSEPSVNRFCKDWVRRDIQTLKFGWRAHWSQACAISARL